MADIEFVEGFEVIGTPENANIIDKPIGSDRDISSIAFTSDFPFYEWTPLAASNGSITMRGGNGAGSGNNHTLQFTGFNNGKINYQTLAEFYDSYSGQGVPSYNIVCIPFYRTTLDPKYLILRVAITSVYMSGSIRMISANLKLVWSNTVNCLDSNSNEEAIAQFGTLSTTFASNSTSCCLADVAVIRDDAIRPLGDEQPLDNTVLVFYRSGNIVMPNDKYAPKVITIKTGNNGRFPVSKYSDGGGDLINADNISYISLCNARINGYGIPKLLDSSPEAGEPSEEGGMGTDGENPTFDDSSDTIAIPTDPGIGVSNVGFVNVYKTGSQSLQNMGVELFPPLQYTAPTAITATDTMEAVVNGFNSLVTFLANIPSFFDQIMANTLINYVIDCHIIPVTPTGGVNENIKVGYKTLQCTGTRLTNDYVNVSCGSIYVGEYYTNFADFITTAKLYLPFVGFVSTRPEWFQNDTLRVDYKFNIVDGSFTCYVRSGGKYVNNKDSSGTIVAQYGGNACIHLPITGVTYSNMVSGLVGAGTGAIAGAASGNIAAAATSAISAASVHGDISQSNAYNGSAAFLGCRYPFLMIERPVSSYSKNYQHEIGIPANIYARIGDVSGYIRADNVHLDGITCTDEERKLIAEALRKGVLN